MGFARCCKPPERLPSNAELEARLLGGPAASNSALPTYTAAPSQDVWAFGLLAFEVLSGMKPWEVAVRTDEKYFAYIRWRRYITDGRIIGKRHANDFTGAEAVLAPWSLYGDSVAACMAATMQVGNPRTHA